MMTKKHIFPKSNIKFMREPCNNFCNYNTTQHNTTQHSTIYNWSFAYGEEIWWRATINQLVDWLTVKLGKGHQQTYLYRLSGSRHLKTTEYSTEWGWSPVLLPATTQDEPKPENRSSIKLRTSPGERDEITGKRGKRKNEMKTGGKKANLSSTTCYITGKTMVHNMNLVMNEFCLIIVPFYSMVLWCMCFTIPWLGGSHFACTKPKAKLNINFYWHQPIHRTL